MLNQTPHHDSLSFFNSGRSVKRQHLQSHFLAGVGLQNLLVVHHTVHSQSTEHCKNLGDSICDMQDTLTKTNMHTP